MQKNLRIISLLVVALSLIIVFNGLYSVNPYLVKEIPIEMEISNFIGFDINTTALTFGKIPPGSTSSKKITVNNNKNKEVLISLKTYGETTKFITLEQNNFILLPYESKEINIFATAPLNSNNGIYSGGLKVYSFNP